MNPHPLITEQLDTSNKICRPFPTNRQKIWFDDNAIMKTIKNLSFIQDASVVEKLLFDISSEIVRAFQNFNKVKYRHDPSVHQSLRGNKLSI